MDTDINFVHREETFNDLAVREIAKRRSACVCMMQFGRCKKEECAECSIGIQYRNCYNQMSDYDKLRLAEKISEYYAEDSSHPEQWMSFKRLIIYICSIIIAFFIAGILLALMFFYGFPGDKPFLPDYARNRALKTKVPDKYNAMIIETLRQSHATIHDYNRDRLVNCIDYTVAFKLYWDKNYPQYKMNCHIVRNIDLETGLHHLYIIVYDDDYNGHFVEPYCNNIYEYSIKANWGNKIDHNNDIFNETSYWLKVGGKDFF